jgi:hypothetical protein
MIVVADKFGRFIETCASVRIRVNKVFWRGPSEQSGQKLALGRRRRGAWLMPDRRRLGIRIACSATSPVSASRSMRFRLSSMRSKRTLRPPRRRPANAGDVWTWTAIDADTKLIPSWFVGGRDSDAAIIFMDDLASRLANRVQLTSDGHKAYLEAVGRRLRRGCRLRYAGEALWRKPRSREALQPSSLHRRSQDADRGQPDPDHVSTSYAERSNLNVRMHTGALLG